MPDELSVPAVEADEGDQLESHVVELALSGAFAQVGLEAVADCRRLGLPLTLRRGRHIVTLHPDGREEVIKELPELSYSLPSGVRRLDPK